MSNLQWQQRISAQHPNTITYGIDFPEQSVCLKGDTLIVIGGSMDFDTFYQQEGLAEQMASKTFPSWAPSPPGISGMVVITSLSVLDFFAFIERMELQEHAYDIICKWSKSRREARHG